MKVINAEQFTFVSEPVLSDQILPKWTLLQNSLRKKELFLVILHAKPTSFLSVKHC